MLLTQTTTPEDVKALNRAELPQLCDEIRHAILESSAAVGGHVAPNLGVFKVMVGGSPISKKFADDIGAEGYSVNAVEAVKVAKELTGIA